jgi:SAM-dependent methyltransferase
MTPDQIRAVYNSRYAAEYDARFLESELAKPDAQFEIATLKDLLNPGSRWLDVACGTGYFLSLFPEIERAGLDVSPAMLEVAGARNPGVQFHCRSYLEPMPEWQDHWSLVSCMWYAYGYVSSMIEFGQLVNNLSAWTGPDGACLLPLCDPRLLTGLPIPYQVSGCPWPGQVIVTGITWSYIEEKGARHEDQITPQVPHILALFREHFEQLDLITYPSARQALLARKKHHK